MQPHTLDLGARAAARKSLVALPDDLAPDLAHLVVSKCENLRSVDAASGLVSLESIALDRCPSLDVEAAMSSLANLPRLRDLRIGHRDLTRLPRTLAKLGHLTSVTLVDGARLDFDDAFTLLAELPNLRELRIEQVKRVALPDSIGRLTQLRGFFANNALKSVPDALRRLDKLEALGLAGANLTEIPSAVLALTNLRELDLSRNALRGFPETLVALSRLESLDLSASAIATLPNSIAKFQQLRTLNLSFCGLDQLPAAIGDLARLESLMLLDDKIETLPRALMRLSNLRRLELKQCKRLRALPEDLGRLTNLEYLNVHTAKIEGLPESIGELAKLEELDLTGAPLAGLPESFAHLTRLRKLSFGNARFASPPPQLGGLEALEVLKFFGKNEPPLNVGELFAVLGRLPRLTVLVMHDLRGCDRVEGSDRDIALPPQIGQLRSVRELYLGTSWGPYVGALPVELAQLDLLREFVFADVAINDRAAVVARLPRGRWRRSEGDDTVYRRTDAD